MLLHGTNLRQAFALSPVRSPVTQLAELCLPPPCGREVLRFPVFVIRQTKAAVGRRSPGRVVAKSAVFCLLLAASQRSTRSNRSIASLVQNVHLAGPIGTGAIPCTLRLRTHRPAPGGRGVSETRRIRSHYFLPDGTRTSRTLTPLCSKAGPHPILSMLRLCDRAEETPLPPTEVPPVFHHGQQTTVAPNREAA